MYLYLKFIKNNSVGMGNLFPLKSNIPKRCLLQFNDLRFALADSFKFNACDLPWKRQDKQLITLIYGVGEIADGRVNETAPSNIACLRRAPLSRQGSVKRETHNDVRAERPS